MRAAAPNSPRSPQPGGFRALAPRSPRPSSTEGRRSLSCLPGKPGRGAAPTQSVHLPNKTLYNSLVISGVPKIKRYKMPIHALCIAAAPLPKISRRPCRDIFRVTPIPSTKLPKYPGTFRIPPGCQTPPALSVVEAKPITTCPSWPVSRRISPPCFQPPACRTCYVVLSGAPPARRGGRSEARLPHQRLPFLATRHSPLATALLIDTHVEQK